MRSFYKTTMTLYDDKGSDVNKYVKAGSILVKVVRESDVRKLWFSVIGRSVVHVRIIFGLLRLILDLPSFKIF